MRAFALLLAASFASAGESYVEVAGFAPAFLRVDDACVESRERMLGDPTDSQMRVLQRLIDATQPADPEMPDLRFRMGELLHQRACHYAKRKGDAAGAKDWARKAVESYMAAARATGYTHGREALLGAIGLQAFVGDNPIPYLAVFGGAVPGAMRDPRVLLERGAGFLPTGRYDMAEKDLREAAKPGSPVRAYAQYYLGWVDLLEGRQRGARKTFEAIRLPDTAPLAHRNELARSAAIASAHDDEPAATIALANKLTSEPAQALRAAAEIHAWAERMHECWALYAEYHKLEPAAPEPCAAREISQLKWALRNRIGTYSPLEAYYRATFLNGPGPLARESELGKYLEGEQSALHAAIESLRIEPSPDAGTRVAYTGRDGASIVVQDKLTNVVEWTNSSGTVTDAMERLLLAEFPSMARSRAAIESALALELPALPAPAEGESYLTYLARVGRSQDDGVGTLDERAAKVSGDIARRTAAALKTYGDAVRALAPKLRESLPAALREKRVPLEALKTDDVALALRRADGRTAVDRYLDEAWVPGPALDDSVKRCTRSFTYGQPGSLDACVVRRFEDWFRADVVTGKYGDALAEMIDRDVERAFSHYESATRHWPSRADQYRDQARVVARSRTKTPAAFFFLGRVEEHQNQFGPAARAYRTNLRLAPKGAEAREARRRAEEMERRENNAKTMKDMFE